MECIKKVADVSLCLLYTQHWPGRAKSDWPRLWLRLYCSGTQKIHTCNAESSSIQTEKPEENAFSPVSLIAVVVVAMVVEGKLWEMENSKLLEGKYFQNIFLLLLIYRSSPSVFQEHIHRHTLNPHHSKRTSFSAFPGIASHSPLSADVWSLSRREALTASPPSLRSQPTGPAEGPHLERTSS